MISNPQTSKDLIISSHPVEASFAVDVLEDGFVQSQLQTGLVEHFPLVRVPGDQPVDFHRFALANPVAACLGLIWNGSGKIYENL